MELRHLRYFKAVAELLNFSRAAEQMRVAQPALSRQIRALEDELGTRLLDRHRGVRLTDAGRTFYTQTCKILAQVDIAIAAVREPPDRTGGELIVCNDWRISGHFLPAAVSEFHRQFLHGFMKSLVCRGPAGKGADLDSPGSKSGQYVIVLRGANKGCGL